MLETFSILFNLLSASITILLSLFSYFLLFSINYVVTENIKVKIVLAIPAGTPITLVRN